MTVRETGFLIWGYYKNRLNFFERKLLEKLLDGISGLGEIDDNEIQSYLSDKQIGFIKKLGQRFRLLKRSGRSF